MLYKNFSGQTRLPEERRREILMNLERERELRRKRVAESNMCQPYSKDDALPKKEQNNTLDMEININTEDIKDPHDILLTQEDNNTSGQENHRTWKEDLPQSKVSTISMSPIKNKTETPNKTQPNDSNNNVFDTNLMKECLEYSVHVS